MSNLENMTLIELKKLAKENNIRNISKLKKEELIDILSEINEVDNSSENESATDEIQETKKYDAADEELDSENSIEESTVSYQVNNEEDEIIEGILEVLPDGYGFLRGDNFLSTPKDVYI